jgi:alpha-ketoglutarate-dependent taurine dioxygenase
VIGGTSIFVDALHAASAMRTSDPESFDVLASRPVSFHYINDGHHLHYQHPTIELSTFPSASHPPKPIAHINYSPPFQAPLPLATPTALYSDLSRFTRLLNDPENTYASTLKEGDAVIFDNRRVLHARTAFHDKRASKAEENMGEGETNRWLKGCYLEADALLDWGRYVEEQG